MVGIVLMIGSVILFGYEGADAKVPAPISIGDKQLQITHISYTSTQKVYYSLAALALGMLSPFCYTFKAFAIRKFCANYKAWDVGVDALIFEHLAYCIMYVGYLSYSPWRWEEFWYG